MAYHIEEGIISVEFKPRFVQYSSLAVIESMGCTPRDEGNYCDEHRKWTFEVKVPKGQEEIFVQRFWDHPDVAVARTIPSLHEHK